MDRPKDPYPSESMAWMSFWLDGAEKKRVAFRRVDEFSEGVIVQADRIVKERSQVRADVHFFFVAANNLRAAAHAIAERYHDRQAHAAVAAYDSVGGDAKNLRDFIEHFEDYDWGEGRLQRSSKGQPATLPATRAGSTEVFEWTPSDLKVEILGVRVSVAAVASAAGTLAATIRAREPDVPDW